MKKHFTSFLLAATSFTGFSFSQQDTVYVSTARQEIVLTDEPVGLHIYHASMFDYDFQECFPDKRWMEMLKKARTIGGDKQWGPDILTNKDFNNLAVVDLISYFNQLEVPSQNCNGYEEYTPLLEIPKYLNVGGFEATNSKRQRDALNLHRDSVVLLIGNCGREHERFSDLMKSIIITVNGYELIPDLIKIYKDLEIKQPTYLTTLLCIMLDDREYKPFQNSYVYKQYLNGGSSLPYTEKMEVEIIKLAKAYHSAKSKE